MRTWTAAATTAAPPEDVLVEVRASVSVKPSRGLAGRLLAEATGALLTAGALEEAVSRIAREAVTC